MKLIGQMKTWITSKNNKILPTYSYKQQKNLNKYINPTRICACLVSSLSKARKKDGGWGRIWLFNNAELPILFTL